MSTAIVFSGQGAQYEGMGRELYDKYGVCRDVFDKAEEAAGFPLKSVCFDEGKTEQLNDTRYCQPCVFTHSAAALALLEERGFKADAVAGLSLGEYTALMCAEAINFEDTVKLLVNRGNYMAEASSMVDGVMSAVMGLGELETIEVCAEASVGKEVVSVSNFNTLGQLVISGARAAVERAEAICKRIGAKRCARLPVSGPYHTVYMAPAAEKLEKCLNSIDFNDMSVPVVSNVNGDIIENKRNIRPTLVKQVCAAVKWAECVKKLAHLGTDTFVEVGPGRTLSGFIKKLAPEAKIVNVQDLESFDKACKELGL